MGCARSLQSTPNVIEGLLSDEDVVDDDDDDDDVVDAVGLKVLGGTSDASSHFAARLAYVLEFDRGCSADVE